METFQTHRIYQTYLGIDFGGTKLLIGEVDGGGKLLRSKKYDSFAVNLRHAADTLIGCLDDYCATVGFVGRLIGAGAGVVGVTDYDKGLWLSLDHKTGATPIPLTKLIQDKLHVPVRIDNDVRSATVGERLFGCGKATDNFVYLNVGTGIAAGFVLHGNLLRGKNNNAGEIGHMVVDMEDDTPCVCGRTGCVENIVSGLGFARQYGRLICEYPDTRLNLDEHGRIDALELFALADEGDPLSLRITDKAAKALACLIMNVVRVADPEMVILGGGVVSDGWLLRRVEPYLSASTMRGVTGGVKLSALDPREIGVIGAASLVYKQTEEVIQCAS
jgi:predicted NBD/HSP70 family sugar kinase